MKWKREKPGFYRATASAMSWGVIERGGSTGWWWWSARTVLGFRHFGRELYLLDAKRCAGEAMDL